MKAKWQAGLQLGVLFGLAFDSLLIHFHRACVMAAGWIVKLFIEDSGAVERAMELFCDTDTRGIKNRRGSLFLSCDRYSHFMGFTYDGIGGKLFFSLPDTVFYRDSRPPDTRSVRLG